MSDPHDAWLAEAVDAARECARDESPASLEGAATRSRIHASLERRRGTSKRRLTLISAVLASLFGSTAFAYYNGWRPFARAPEPTPVASSVAPEEPSRTPRARSGSAAIEQPVSPPIEPVESPQQPPPSSPAIATTPPPPTVTAPRRTPPPVRTATETSTPATTITPPPAPEPALPAPDAELAAYQQAHDAHFKGNDPAAALAAWDRYLARFPDGKLAPEARYDRALVLVKLARWNDAREALRPFATAPAGAYRQREAAKILDAIRDR